MRFINSLRNCRYALFEKLRLKFMGVNHFRSRPTQLCRDLRYGLNIRVWPSVVFSYETNRCLSYEEALKDSLHALVKCTSVVVVWNTSSVGSCQTRVSSFFEWWNNQSSEKPVKTLTKWGNRNVGILGMSSGSALQVCTTVGLLLAQWKEAQHVHVESNLSSGQLAEGVSKPPGSGFIKCNVDASIFHHAETIGFGFIT